MKAHAISLLAGLLVGSLAGIVDPSFGDLSGGGPREFDPATCFTMGSTGVSIGDILSCVVPEPQAGSPAGMPNGIDPERFERVPGVDYVGAHGPEPLPLPVPAGCDTPVRGTWTQDQGVVDRVRRVGGRTIFEVTVNTQWNSGIGEGGRSTFRADVWIEREGYAVAVGRELFEGTIGARTGSATIWNLAHQYPSGRFVAKAYAIGGTEGLENLRFESEGIGFSGKGGHWTSPSRVCFAD